VIPCSADLDLFDPAAINATEKEALRKELSISSDDVIVTYLGSIGGWYLTDELMQFCKILSEKLPATKLLFISPHRHEQIIQAAAKFGINPDRVVIKKAGRQEVPKLLSLSDYSVFFIKPCYSKLSSSPTKHGEIMAMGIPLITNSGVGDVETIVEKYNSGVVIQEFNEAEFAAAADKIASGMIFDADRIRGGAKEFYSLDVAVKKYIAIYNSILPQ
jgi:glycosyltransferase involved in cell wall biosynthesis